MRTVFLPRAALRLSSSFYHPCKDTNSAPSRLGRSGSGRRCAVRAVVGDAAAAVAMMKGLHGRWASRRSLVFPSRLVPECHGWGRSSRHMCSPGRLMRALGGGPPPHATAQHDRRPWTGGGEILADMCELSKVSRWILLEKERGDLGQGGGWE